MSEFVGWSVVRLRTKIKELYEILDQEDQRIDELLSELDHEKHTVDRLRGRLMEDDEDGI